MRAALPALLFLEVGACTAPEPFLSRPLPEALEHGSTPGPSPGSGADDTGGGGAPGPDSAPPDSPPSADSAPPDSPTDSTPPVDTSADGVPGGPKDCSAGTGSGKDCYDGTTWFYNDVRNAVTSVLEDYPSWVDWSDGNPLILYHEDYRLEVVRRVEASVLCAIPDPNAGDEIAVKWNNEFAESFDILSWEGYARYGEGIYTATCAPAWF